ncbi:MAG: pyruvoyl-dependent arginine decarboxylase [Methanobacteriaceae archaeon]
MKISLTAGKSEGPTRLNAFDSALLDAGIGNVNLIPVSSIIPAYAKIVELPQIKEGAMVNCVLAQTYSDKADDLITAVVAVATSEDFGCVVEHSGINRGPYDVRREAETMVRYMMQVRDLEIREIIIEDESHKIKEQGVVIAAVVFLE